MKFTLAFVLAASAAQAQEFITSEGRLADEDFYRLVACAAPTDGACQKPLVRWSPADAQDVSVGFVQIEPGFPADKAKLAASALDAAIAQLNAAHANLHVTLSDNIRKPDISIHLLTIAEGDTIRNTGRDSLDGTRILAAKTVVWWREDLSIMYGDIVFGQDINPKDLPSIMLEELTQSMGLLTDIGGTYYETRSIFSQTSNQLTALGAQDVIALQRHYP